MGMDVPPEKLKFDAYITRKDNDDFRTLCVRDPRRTRTRPR